MKQKLIACLFAGTIALSGCSLVFAEDMTEAVIIDEGAEETDDILSEETDKDISADAAAKANALNQKRRDQLSDDLYSFQIRLDDEVYAFPMSYADFVAKGWEYQGDASTEISPNSYSSSERFQKGELTVYGSIINLGINTVPISDCMIGGFSLDSFQFTDAPDTTTLELPKGILYNVSTLDDIKAAYGEPSDIYEGELYTKLTYSYDYYQEIDLYVDAETNVLNEVDLKNFVYDEEANATAAAEVSDEPTPEVLAYQAPEALSGDLMDYTVEFAGDVYRLPAPVSVFLANGFTLKEQDSDSIVAGRDSGWVSLMKDNQEFRTLTRNYSGNATTIQNCFVTSIDVSTYGDKLSFLLPKDIQLGMSVDELEAALNGISYEKNTESSSDYTYYTVEGTDSSLDGYDFTVNNEEQTVISIEIAYQPRSLE